MGASRKVIAGTLALLVVLAAVAAATKVTDRYQVLPFSDWSLFSTHPPREKVDYGIRFTSIDGAPQDPAVYFESAGFRESASPPAFELIQDLGGHVERGEALRAEAIWRTFAGRFLGEVGSAEVEVVKRSYDVLDRRSCDCYSTETVVGTLVTGP